MARSTSAIGWTSRTSFTAKDESGSSPPPHRRRAGTKITRFGALVSLDRVPPRTSRATATGGRRDRPGPLGRIARSSSRRAEDDVGPGRSPPGAGDGMAAAGGITSQVVRHAVDERSFARPAALAISLTRGQGADFATLVADRRRWCARGGVAWRRIRGRKAALGGPGATPILSCGKRRPSRSPDAASKIPSSSGTPRSLRPSDSRWRCSCVGYRARRGQSLIPKMLQRRGSAGTIRRHPMDRRGRTRQVAAGTGGHSADPSQFAVAL